MRIEYHDPHQIIKEWESIDLEHGQTWPSLIEEKRRDKQYPKLLASISTDGFTSPLLARQFNDGSYEHSNGHHRLAAAMELGIDRVPYLVLTEKEYKDNASFWRFWDLTSSNHGFDTLANG